MTTFAQMPKVKSDKKNQHGATLIEYALLLMLIMAVCVLAVTQLGTATNDSLGNPGLINALS